MIKESECDTAEREVYLKQQTSGSMSHSLAETLSLSLSQIVFVQ